MRKEFPIVKYRREVNTTPEVLDERWVSTAIENRERDKHRQIRGREELNFQRQQLLRMLKRGKDYHRGRSIAEVRESIKNLREDIDNSPFTGLAFASNVDIRRREFDPAEDQGSNPSCNTQRGTINFGWCFRIYSR